MTFDIKRSTKAYINSNEHYIVTSEGVVYLRIVGSEGSYVVMTATAGEDNNGISSYSDMVALNVAALCVSASLGVSTIVKTDYHGREYVEVCKCEYISDAQRAAEKLFSYLNSTTTNRTKNDLAEVYAQIAIDESGADVYLSDGMWLDSDGKITNRSR